MSTASMASPSNPKPIGIGVDFVYVGQMARLLGVTPWLVTDLGQRGLIRTKRLRPRARILYSVADARRVIAESDMQSGTEAA